MSWVFELSAECGEMREAAEAFAQHFSGLCWRLSDGLESCCYTGLREDNEGNWWVGVFPNGISRSGVCSERAAQQMTEVGNHLYERLRSAPPFRYAIVGVESADFISYAEFDQDIVKLPWDGLVVCQEAWDKMGQPDVFIPFAPGYYWRPYIGEVYKSPITMS